MFFTKSYIPIANPLADLGCALPAEIPDRTQIARAWRAYEHETDVRIADAGLTAWKDDSRVNLSGD